MMSGLGVIDDTCHQKAKTKRGHMGAMCHTPKERSSSGKERMKEEREEKEKGKGEKKGERNG